jgi:hypothetical protein
MQVNFTGKRAIRMIFSELVQRSVRRLGLQDAGKLRSLRKSAGELLTVNLAQRADERIAMLPANFPIRVAMPTI